MKKSQRPIGPCKVCGCNKKSNFYWSNKTTCKTCLIKQEHKRRKQKIDYVREYDRKRGLLPHRRKAVKARYKAVMKDPERKKKEWAVKREWLKKNRIKRAAHILTNNAFKDGRLIKEPCEVCGKKKVDAHHDDYLQPLKVRWLCKKHHSEHHKNEREKMRNK